MPRLAAAAEIRAIAAGIAPLPLNVMVTAGLAPAEDLGALGVRRLSAGSALASAALGLTRRLASGFLADGRSEALFGESVDYAAMNALLERG